MLLDPQKVIPVVAQILKPSDFTDTTLGKACAALIALYTAGVAVHDQTVVLRELRAAGCDAAKLVGEAAKIPNVGTFQYHVDRVRNFSRLTQITGIVDGLRNELRTPKAQADEVLAWVESQVMRLRTGLSGSARPFAVIADEVIADLQSRVGNPEPSVLLSGIPGVDGTGFVFGDGELCILAARPGVGKTAFATQIAMHHAGKGRPVLMASLEMRDRELISRILYPTAGINHQWIRTNRVYQEAVDELRAAKEKIGSPPLFVWSPGRVKASVIHAAASVLKSSRDLRLLVVDYLGLVRADDSSRQRYEQVGEMAKALRDIGQHLQIPVLCLCQLNREAGDAEPKLTNLRESGDIEQDADVVAFLHRTDARDQSRVELIVAKDRQGAAGRTPLNFIAEQTRFEGTSGVEWRPPEPEEDSQPKQKMAF